MKTEMEEENIVFAINSDEANKTEPKEPNYTNKERQRSKRKRKWIIIATFIGLVIVSVILIVLSRLLRFGIWQVVNSSESSSTSSTPIPESTPYKGCKDAFCSSEYVVCYTTDCQVCSNVRPVGTYYGYDVVGRGWSMKKTPSQYYDGGVVININDATKEACKLDASKYPCLSSNELPNAVNITYSTLTGIHLVCA